MLHRFIEEVRCREKIVRIFPDMGSVKRLVGAPRAETCDERATGRHCLRMDEFLKWQVE